MPEPQRRCAKCGAAYGAAVTFCPADGSPVTLRSVRGEASRYVGIAARDDLVLSELIGVGAMASVYRARQSGVERDVAVKVLHAELAANPLLVARFQREARAAARIRHPNVIEVVALGALPNPTAPAETVPFLALEYLDGLTLRSALSAAGGTLPLGRAVHIVLQLCDGLAAAHALGIVHRDLKPENLMLVRRGDDTDFVKVLDFGLSHMAEVEAAFETHAGAVLGTARYVSPEGARGEPVTASSDVYSIATLLFECLSGRAPFEADSPLAVLVQKSQREAPDLRSVQPACDVPAPIAELVALGLTRDPSARPADARRFGQALLGAAAQSGLGASELSPRPTLFGASPRLTSAERTRLLGSPEPSALPGLAHASTRGQADASNFAEPFVPRLHPAQANDRHGVRRVGFVATCFGLGALGALGVATQLGSCGKSWP